jgi:hypothetical protein
LIFERIVWFMKRKERGREGGGEGRGGRVKRGGN